MGLFSIFRHSSGKKSKKYQAIYSTFVSNPNPHAIDTTLILPMPTTYPFQTLLSHITTSPLPNDVSREPAFGNRYIWWDLSLKPKEEKLLKMQFQVEVEVVKTKLEDFYLSDYSSHDVNPALLASNSYIQFDHPKVKEIAFKLIDKEDSLERILEKINAYVISNLDYGNPITGLYTLKETLEGKKVDCGGYDVLFCALCRSLGIPATLASGFWAGYDHNNMHAWVIIQLPDKSWTVADPSIEYLNKQHRTKKTASLFSTPADRIALSVGDNLEIQVGNKKLNVGILQNPVLLKNSDELKLAINFETKVIK